MTLFWGLVEALGWRRGLGEEALVGEGGRRPGYRPARDQGFSFSSPSKGWHPDGTSHPWQSLPICCDPSPPQRALPKTPKNRVRCLLFRELFRDNDMQHPSQIWRRIFKCHFDQSITSIMIIVFVITFDLQNGSAAKVIFVLYWILIKLCPELQLALDHYPERVNSSKNLFLLFNCVFFLWCQNLSDVSAHIKILLLECSGYRLLLKCVILRQRNLNTEPS